MCTRYTDMSRCFIVQQPDPNQPKPEGDQMAVLKGEPLSVGTSGPLSLLAALQLWGTTQPKAPCLTALDTAGKATCTLTYGKYQQKVSCLPSTLHCLCAPQHTRCLMHTAKQENPPTWQTSFLFVSVFDQGHTMSLWPALNSQ